MKTSLPLLLLPALALFAFPLLHAQDSPPPPPEQIAPADQGAPPPDQGPGAPSDQGAPMDGAPDQGAPPPDQSDQGAPPPDQGSPDDQDASGASFQTFYDQLSSQGDWVQTDNYGYVWQPNVQDPDWRPYTQGHWVYTEDGWTWVADASEPWGWATYHYGRWVNIDGEGWAWVPGYTWAPAWVSWRYGGGYCGWAPLPPETSVGIDFGDVRAGFLFHIGGDCDTAYDIGPGYYNFVPVGYIGAGNYRPYYANRYDNFRIINNTRNVTNIVVNNNSGGAGRFGRVSTGGPNFATVNAQSRTPVQRATLVSSGRVGNASMQGNRLAVFAPQVRATTAARPTNVTSRLSAVNVNRGVNISQPLAVNSRITPAGPSAQQVQTARAAQANLPRTARIATTSTHISHSLSAPLSSLAPHGSSVRPQGTVGSSVHPATTAAGPASVPRTTSDRADSAFTGGDAAGHSETTHQAESNNTPAVSHQSTFTPHPQAESAPIQHQESAPIEHFENAPVQHEQAPQVEHHESTPVQHEEAPQVEHHESAPSEQHISAPPEHHESAPITHQSAPIQQHQANAPHPGGGGGGGGKPSGKPDDKNDGHQH